MKTIGASGPGPLPLGFDRLPQLGHPSSRPQHLAEARHFELVV
jgi:hypothetical protein